MMWYNAGKREITPQDESSKSKSQMFVILEGEKLIVPTRLSLHGLLFFLLSDWRGGVGNARGCVRYRRWGFFSSGVPYFDLFPSDICMPVFHCKKRKALYGCYFKDYFTILLFIKFLNCKAQEEEKINEN